LLGLAVLLPLFALVSLLVKIADRGPVFFRQERVGYRGRRFRIWKFRTMVPDAPRLGMSLTVGEDDRITRVGRLLRRLKLDELPQLFNVLAGEMSLVGPRPEVPRFVALYTSEQRQVLNLMPGMTDVASIEYRAENDILARSADPERAYVEEILPHKIHLSLEYAGRATAWTDLLLVLRTLRIVGAGRDAAIDAGGPADPGEADTPPGPSSRTGRASTDKNASVPAG
jgi:lipopolysaccharide/colanic/teichoic acid biosynthesis glycosyltransferase